MMGNLLQHTGLGTEGVSSGYVLNKCTHQGAEPLCDVLQHSTSAREAPERWKTAESVPAHESGSEEVSPEPQTCTPDE